MKASLRPGQSPFLPRTRNSLTEFLRTKMSTPRLTGLASPSPTCLTSSLVEGLRTGCAGVRWRYVHPKMGARWLFVYWMGRGRKSLQPTCIAVQTLIYRAAPWLYTDPFQAIIGSSWKPRCRSRASQCQVVCFSDPRSARDTVCNQRSTSVLFCSNGSAARIGFSGRGLARRKGFTHYDVYHE